MPFKQATQSGHGTLEFSNTIDDFALVVPEHCIPGSLIIATSGNDRLDNVRIGDTQVG